MYPVLLNQISMATDNVLNLGFGGIWRIETNTSNAISEN